jgi:hypothetical protein
MTCGIGSWVKWNAATHTRLGYKPSDIGKVVGVRDCPSSGREIDVEFADGNVVRGAFERWFEPARISEPEMEAAEDGLLAGEIGLAA